MDTKYKEQLTRLCFVQSHSSNEKRMVLYLYNELKKLNLSPEIDKVGNILVTKGNAKTYPCVVAHLDTVHKIVDGYKLFTKETKDGLILYAKNGKHRTGVGGDDKCGIFACLYFLQVLPAVKVVFFTQEEVGCIGSNGINDNFFEDCRYILQLDRRGNSDFISTYHQQKTVSHTFASETGHTLKKYGFKNTTGVWTDSINLWDKEVGISCANISSGYYCPHSSTEYISIKDLWNSILFTKELITTLKSKRYISSPESLPVKKFRNTSLDKMVGLYRSDESIQGRIVKPSNYSLKCENCKTWADFYTTLNKKAYCYDCLKWDCKTNGWIIKDTTENNITAKDTKTKSQVLEYISLHKSEKSPVRCDVCNFWFKENNGKAALGLGFVCYSCLRGM